MCNSFDFNSMQRSTGNKNAKCRKNGLLRKELSNCFPNTKWSSLKAYI